MVIELGHLKLEGEAEETYRKQAIYFQEAGVDITAYNNILSSLNWRIAGLPAESVPRLLILAADAI